MKLLCIDTPKIFHPDCRNVKPIIEVGQIYTYNDEDGNAYELKEHIGWSYHKRLFIPCSDISETEFVREYKKELV